MPGMKGGNGATSLAGSSGLAPPRAQEGSQGARNELLPLIQTDQHSASQALRAAEDSNKYNKEKFITNEAKGFIGRVDLIKDENWINNMKITFRVMQVPHRHKIRLATIML